tara:strand:- start:410 stop:577 length:168 start_codon:yes stop_codon:yes gene_type:complete
MPEKSDNLLQVKITIITIVIGAIIGVIFDGNAEASEQLPSHLQHIVKEPVLKVAF